VFLEDRYKRPLLDGTTFVYIVNGVVDHGQGLPVGTANPYTGSPYNTGNGKWYTLTADVNFETIYEPSVGKVVVGNMLNQFSVNPAIFVDTDKKTAFSADPVAVGVGMYGNFQTGAVSVTTPALSSGGRVAIRTNNGWWDNVDSGEKLLNYKIVASQINAFATQDVYIDGIYSFTQNQNNINIDKLNTIYVPSTNVPIAPCDVVQNRAIYPLEGGTILANPTSYSYRIENIFSQNLQFFLLFGQYYAFDGAQIWAVPTVSDVASGPLQRVCPAQGLVLLSVAPEAAYFLSNFDNSIFIFNGGRSLQKLARLNKKAAIEYGIYNVEENAMHLITTNSVIIQRDGVSTENPRPFANGKINLYSTVNGVIYGQANQWKSLQYQSNVFSSGATALVPLDLQTGFVGPMINTYMKTPQFMVYLRRPAGPGNLTLTFTYYWIDAETSGSEVKVLAIDNTQFDAEGYTRVKYQPTKDSVVGSSLRIQANDRVVILDIVQYYSTIGPAQVGDLRTAQPLP
jgi:hypothetical protein